MVRISGVEIPAEKKVKTALTYIYGLGKKNVFDILRKADINFSKKTGQLTDMELSRLQKIISSISVEGGLKKNVIDNIKRLTQIKSYRGLRHLAKLPVRGQRTRSNARTKRGKRITIGAMKKEMLRRGETDQKTKTKEANQDG